MAGTVDVTYNKFFSLSRIEPFFPKALEVLIELASKTNLNFRAIFRQIRREDHPEVHEGIELHVFWENERFAVIYYIATPGRERLMARDYQFPQGQQDRQLPWTTKEEGVAILATFLESVISSHQRFLGHHYQALQKLKSLCRQATAA